MTHTRGQVEIVLEYTTGEDDPDARVFRRYPIPPDSLGGLALAIRDYPGAEEGVFPENPSQLQVHLIGTADALEALGTYLIALARLDTSNPEPTGSLDDVRNVDGGTIRLIPRRVQTAPPVRPRTVDYREQFCT